MGVEPDPATELGRRQYGALSQTKLDNIREPEAGVAGVINALKLKWWLSPPDRTTLGGAKEPLGVARIRRWAPSGKPAEKESGSLTTWRLRRIRGSVLDRTLGPERRSLVGRVLPRAGLKSKLRASEM